ncbi:adenylate/guanylate cyclase domain-containing protein [Spirulina major CS-329]|uniref:adenylate/guanylate cyclase domain-containing protein n=1 Tax=Spirulina sp. TaxID=1157 RepID=UPI003F711501|nr:adenylate/guanylate cyclase domain-containing protein [Spirulina subsalsa CS-330]MDB9504772.1 adenylate/guanylate cyclase domain-containing protein [Spirulina major CS-329]
MLRMLLRVGSYPLKHLPLRVVLVLPFVLQLFAAVGIVGYLSFRNGQKAVADLANQVIDELGNRIEQEVITALGVPHQINQTNAQSIRLGLLDLNETRGLEYQFWQQLQTFDDITAIFVGNPEGGIVLAGRSEQGFPFLRLTENFKKGNYYRYSTDSRANRQELLETKTYDASQRPWFLKASETRRAAWSDIYLFVSTQTPGITASQPIYDEVGTLTGVLGVDLSLDQLSQFLRGLDMSEESEVFIVDRAGKLIASSTEESPFIPNTEEQRPATTSEIPQIRGAATSLTAEFGNWRNIDRPQKLRFEIADTPHFVNVLPLRDEHGLDWLVVMVVPEQNFMAQIQQSNQTTVILCLVALAIATGVGILTARWVTSPILRLSQSARQLAEGEWTQPTPIERNDELGELAIAFNMMAKQLQSSFSVLERSNRDLEERVAERTATLATKEAELRGLFEAMTELVLVFDYNGCYKRIPSGNLRLLIHTKDKLLGRTLHDIFPDDQADYFLTQIRTVLETGRPVSFEYQINLPQGTIWCLGNISRISLDTVVWVARDITDYKKSEASLRQSELQNRAIITAIPDLMFRVNRNGIYLGFMQSYGVKNLLPSDFDPVGEHITTFLLPEVAERHLYHIKKALESGRVQVYEQQILIDGQQQDEEVRVVPYGDDEVLFMIRNITEQKAALREREKAEIALRESEDKNRAILTAIPDLMIRFSGDGVYLDYLAAPDFTPQIHGDMDRLGKHVTDILPPETAQAFLTAINAALTTGTMQIDEVSFTVDQQVFQQEIRTVVSGENEVLMIIRDITERKAAKEALEKSLALQKAVLESITDAVIAVDYSDNIIAYNQNFLAMWDVTSEVLMSPNQSDRLMPLARQVLDPGAFLKRIQDLHNRPAEESFELLEFRDGRVLERFSRPQKVGDEIVGRVWGFRDITERKRAEQRLRIERERAEKLLLNILPVAIAEQLKQQPGSLAEQFENVTILFADIVGFTPLSAQMKPIELVEFLNHIFSTFDQLTEQFGLEKIKTIGDAYMVVGGLPQPRSDHAEAIANMALAMQKVIETITATSGKPFQIRIGINSGSVVAGVIGIKKFIYDLWGDAVNVASRMESLGEPGKIQVTQAVYERLHDQFTFDFRGALQVKGKGEMSTYWLVGQRDMNMT